MIASRHNRRGLCVLVVDEHPDTADTLAALLYLDGHCSHVAYDPITALVVAVEQLPDVVLLDLGVPGMDGCDLARHLSGQTRERRPLIVATCGFLDDDHRRRAAEAGIHLYWSKPVDPQVILQFVNCYQKVFARQKVMPGAERVVRPRRFPDPVERGGLRDLADRMRADYFAERVSRIGRRVVAWRQQVREWGQGVASVVARSRSRLAVSRAFCRDVAARY